MINIIKSNHYFIFYEGAMMAQRVKSIILYILKTILSTFFIPLISRFPGITFESNKINTCETKWMKRLKKFHMSHINFIVQNNGKNNFLATVKW